MQLFDVDGLHFEFPDDWEIGRYDEWQFYRTQFSRIWNGIRALDLLAVSPDKTAWLVEVKDYRTNARTKPSDLAEEVAQKVFDTLAAIVPSRVRAVDSDEKLVARRVAGAVNLRVVLHLEQPAKHSRLFPRAIDPAHVKMRLRQFLSCIDPHPIVAETGRMGSLQWQVS